jgi:glycosyltransferase involved in cell wall biosynthesis
MKISIIIPTLNEEKMLPKLLESIKGQDFDDYEVIVADAASKDRTREIAREYGCRVVDGGLPAAGRNAGARAASGDFFFFLDADVILPQGFIRNVYNEMQDRYLDLATCKFYPLSDYQLDRFVHRLMNLAVILNLWIDPKAFGFCIFVTRRLFERVSGFDETIYVAEDNDFVKRGSEICQMRLLTQAHIMVSVRRFEKEGRFSYIQKGIKLNLYRTFKGEIRNDQVVKYEFDAFYKLDNPEGKNFMDKLEERLLRLEEHSARLSAEAKHKNRETNIKHFRPKLSEYSHLIDELDMYLSKNQRRAQKISRFLEFFKRKLS